MLEKSISFAESKFKEMTLKHFISETRAKKRDPIAINELLGDENGTSSLIGYIDPLGQFKLNLHSIGIEL
jgi:hypothetical protein